MTNMTVIIPGCGDLPSAAELMQKLKHQYPSAKFTMIAFDPDAKSIEALSKCHKNTLEFTWYFGVCNLKQYAESTDSKRADIIYLEHPIIDLPSKWCGVSYRDQIFYLLPLMKNQCSVRSWHKNELEVAILYNLVKYCFVEPDRKVQHCSFGFGYYGGVRDFQSSQELSGQTIATENKQLDLVKAQELTTTLKESDLFLSKGVMIAAALLLPFSNVNMEMPALGFLLVAIPFYLAMKFQDITKPHVAVALFGIVNLFTTMLAPLAIESVANRGK